MDGYYKLYEMDTELTIFEHLPMCVRALHPVPHDDITIVHGIQRFCFQNRIWSGHVLLLEIDLELSRNTCVVFNVHVFKDNVST